MKTEKGVFIKKLCISLFSKAFFISMLSLYANPTFSQKNQLDVLYLKNGSIVKGKIIESDTKVKIQTQCDNIWVFDKNEIEKTLKEKAFKTNKIVQIAKGYTASLEISMLTGDTGPSSNRWNIISPAELKLCLLMINGYSFGNNVFAGIGTGIEFFEFPVVPLFIDLKYDFFKKKLSPYVFFDGGYAFPIAKNISDRNLKQEGGILYSMGLGMRKIRKDKSSFIVSVGYRYQSLKQDFIEDGIEHNFTYNRFLFRLGFIF